MCTIFAHTACAMNILYKIDKIYHRFDTLPYSKLIKLRRQTRIWADRCRGQKLGSKISKI